MVVFVGHGSICWTKVYKKFFQNILKMKVGL